MCGLNEYKLHSQMFLILKLVTPYLPIARCVCVV